MRQLIFYVIIISFFSCGTETKKTPAKKPLNSKPTPIFNSDSAYSFVEKQVSFGPRVISSRAWDECSKYLEAKLKSYNADVKIQTAPVTTYDGKNHTLRNIIASFDSQNNNRVALFAHWDSRHIADHDTINQDKPILGANDGGSGVGVLIEIARIINETKPKVGVDIILFDAEDYGQPENSKYPIMSDSWCLGAQHWSKNPHKKNYFAKYTSPKQYPRKC